MFELRYRSYNEGKRRGIAADWIFKVKSKIQRNFFNAEYKH